MQTSCPECGTTFRVSQDQLGLRRGLVRCGSCNAVFNAYDTLLPELEGAPPQSEVAEVVVEAAVPEIGTETAESPSWPPSEPSLEPPGESTVQPGLWAEIEAELAMPGDLPDVPPRDALAAYLETAADHVPADAEITLDEMDAASSHQGESASKPESPDDILLSELPHRQAERPGRSRWKTALYGIVILLLAVTLVGQLAYFLRGELAAALPGSRPLLNALCQPLACVVPLPRQLTRQSIVSSSLEHDAEQKSRVRLTFLLANRTNQSQAWPHVTLTLSDVRESPVAQKAFPPKAYLPRGVSVPAGFPAQSEQEARVDLDIGSLAAASYIISVAYP